MTVPIFDGHNDSLTKEFHHLLVSGGGAGHLDLPRMREANLRGGIFAVYVESARSSRRARPTGQPGVAAVPFASRVPQPRAAAVAQAAAGRLLALEREGYLRVGRVIADIDAAVAEPEGPPVAVLHIEGAEMIDPDLEALDFWYAAGLRSLGPVWSRPNAFAEGVPFIYGAGPDTGPGLTEAGQALVRRCADLGILVDLAHLNERGFWDVARLDLGPLVVSHAGACARALTSRNLTDAQLDAVAASGGLVGIVFAVYFLHPQFQTDPDVGLGLIVDHARYVADRIGVDHVAFGSDFDGTVIPSELGSVAGLPRLLDALSDAGFSAEEIERIAWRNWRRVLDASWR